MAEQSPMKSGRELDALIAEKVMGWGWVGRQNTKWFAPLSSIGTDADTIYGPIRAACDDDKAEDGWWLRDSVPAEGVDVVPHYSTDIAAAWKVVEKMRERGWIECYIDSYSPKQRDGFAANFWRSGERGGNHCSASTAPLAICRAALAALVPPTPGARD